jgi:predicted Holliday junction resolvase-like endonuclease
VKILPYVIVLVSGLITALFLVIRNLKAEMRVLKAQLETSEKEKDGFAKQVQRLTNAAEITTANEKEANEKIDEVYSGDAVDNALSGLSKHKN